VFHPVHTGRDRLGDAPRAMRVRGDRQPGAMGGLTCGPELNRAVLRLVHTESRRHQPTGRHDLDDVHPGSHPLRHRSSDTVDPVRRTTKKPAVPTRAGDRRPGHQQLRTPRPGTAQTTGEVAGVAQVTHRRDPRREGPRGIGPHPRQQNLVIHSDHVNQGIALGLERQMHVRVHQPRQQRASANSTTSACGGAAAPDRSTVTMRPPSTSTITRPRVTATPSNRPCALNASNRTPRVTDLADQS
jgi:hypothetical protein